MIAMIRQLIGFMSEKGGTHKERTVRGGYWISIGSLMTRFLELGRSVILARLLSPELFGLIGIVQIVAFGLETLTQTNFKTVLIYKQDHSTDANNTAWVMSIIRGLLLYLIAFAAAPLVASYYNQDILTSALRLYSIVFLISGMSNINMVLYEKELDFKLISLYRIIASIVNFTVTISLAYFLKNVWALIYASVVTTCIETIITFIVQKKFPKFQFNKQIAKELLSYTVYLTGTSIVLFLTLKADDAVVGKVLGMTALGYYTYAYTLANFPATHITKVFSDVIFPSYSALQADHERLGKAYLKVLKFTSYISIPAGFGICVLAEPIILVLLGEKWRAVIVPLQILCFFGLFRSIGATTGPIFQAIGKPKIIFYIICTKLVAILLLIYPLSSRFGLNGASLAVTIPMALEQLYIWIILSKVLKIKLLEIVSTIIKPFINSFVMVLAIIAVRTISSSPIGYDLVISILVGVLSYFSLIYVLDKTYMNDILMTLKLRKQTAVN